ncbi:MAG: hypothetical protein AUG49_20300 [Catenulispora sp. 13_1_20CM_3_70_7]|nr:MAG: hypothetical protein AUG49_20300 [Catenulispora sp. 13_1_20CM_3_70_7]
MSGDTITGHQEELPEGWLPIEQYIQTIPHATIYACFYFTDTAGNPFGLRSTVRPDLWQWPGGDMEHGDASPFATAVRELREETGLAFDGPSILLISTFHGPEPTWPGYAKVGFCFDGGVLTADQLERIRLDPQEHSEWRIAPIQEWRTLAMPRLAARIDLADRARRTGCAEHVAD